MDPTPVLAKILAALHEIRNACPNCGSRVDVALSDVDAALAAANAPTSTGAVVESPIG